MAITQKYRVLAGVLSLLILIGCDSTVKPSEAVRMLFENVLDSAGIDFDHYGNRHRWCEIGPQNLGLATNEQISMDLFDDPEEFAHRHLIRMNGSGAAWFDYDNDGDWDLYLVNGAGGKEVTNALYSNDGDGTFTPRERAMGVLDEGEGMAVAVADFNNDGYTDLLVTNYGGIELFQNEGGKKFTNITARAFDGAIPEKWYGGAAWGDYNRDGLLDFYLCGYVNMQDRPRDTDVRFPMDFNGLPNHLFKNNGDGTFTDVTMAAGVGDAHRKSMQVLMADFNADGWPDILVTNDTDPNSLFLNQQDETFLQFSGPSGVSSTDGSMGIAYGDYNGDGMQDFYISNYTGEAGILLKQIDNQSSNDGHTRNALYKSDFDSPDIMRKTWPKVGWGTGFFDFDNDQDLDLFIANGHLNAVSGDNRDDNMLFENNGQGRFSDVSDTSGITKPGKRINRAAIFADYDNDGRVDVYVVNNGEKTYDASADRKGTLLRNISQGKNNWQNNWFKIRLQGSESNRDAYGTRVRLVAGGKSQVRELVSGAGYFSSNARELYYGLGRYEKVDSLYVIWPLGKQQVFTGLDANQTVLLVEGRGVAEKLQK